MSDTDKQGSWPVVPPVVLSSTFAFASTAEMAASAREHEPHLYTRWSNPTIDVTEARIAALEGADRALVTSSGMSAIHLALLLGLRERGELVVQREVYGGTHELAEDLLAPLGLPVRRLGLDELIAAAAGSKAAIHVELPTNPLVRVLDLRALRAAAPDALIIVDATFATPVNVQPLALGADVVVHSATKYLAGHHDVVAGALAGAAALMDKAWVLRKLTGPVLDPAGAYRLYRGLETLELRVSRQNETAVELARRLDAHPAVRRVHHPALASHPDHALAKELLAGVGGVFSFELAGGAEAAARVADGLEIFANAPSLGGVRSVVSWPAGVSHVGLSEEDRARTGIGEGLVRLALGIEPVDALWADLKRVLSG